MALEFLNDAYFAAKVGIGETNPTEKLEINGQYGKTTLNGHVVAYTRASANYLWASAVGGDLRFTVNGNTVGSPAMMISTAGSVGIGTTSPVSIVDISSTAPILTIGGVAVNQFESGRIRFTEAAGTSAGFQGSYIHYDGSTNKLHLGMHNTADTTVSNDVNAITILRESANVGIGTTTPTSKLQVSGNAYITGQFGQGVAIANKVAAYGGEFRTSGASAQIFFGRSGSNIGSGAIGADSTYVFRVWTIPGFGNPFVIKQDGNVGIGTTSPSQKLHVHSTSGDGMIRVSGDNILNSGGEIKGFNNGFAFNVAPNGGGTYVERMRINGSGNVGIATTSPGYKLDVNDTARVRGELRIGANINAYQGDASIWVPNVGQAFTVKANTGDVGIGEVSPDRKLHVNSGSDNANTIFESTDTAVTIRLKDSTGSAEIESRNDFRFSNNAGVDQRMVISSAGAIKFNNYNSTNNIGTPTYLLGTDGSGNIVKTLPQGSGTAGPYLPLAGGTMTAGAVVAFLASNGSTDDRLKFGTTGQMQLFHDGSDGYIINSLGDMRMDVNTFRVRSSSGTETMIKATQNAGVELYYNDSKKFETTTTGVNVTGSAFFVRSGTNGTTGSPYYETFLSSGISSTNLSAIQLGNTFGSNNGTELRFQINNTSGASTPINSLLLNTSGATFAGDVVANGTIQTLASNANLTISGDTSGNVYYNNTAGEHRWRANGSSVNSMTLSSSLLTVNEPATFAGNVFPSTNGGGSLGLGSNQWSGLDLTSSSSITWANGDASILEGEVGGYSLSFNVYNGSTTMERVLLLEKTKAATFSGQAFATTATSTGDASSTLTTKGYVDSLITGATIYRGTWDPDVSLNSGYGNPNLNTVTQTSGYYYICSADGAATPNGATTEPNSWNTGDWVIWNDDIGASGEWQKIDNSSVLSGVGTGQTVALWEGDGSVTDSETLGNAPITVSGSDTTFAGKINLSSNKGVVWPGGSIRAEGNTLKLVATTLIDLQDNTQVQGTLTTTGNATFAGTGEFAGAIRITETATAQHILIGNQDSGGTNKPGMIRSSNASLQFGYGNSWSGEGGTMTTSLTIGSDSNATFAGSITATNFITTTDTGININGITLTRVAANSAIRVSQGLETLGLLRSYSNLIVATTGNFGGDVSVEDNFYLTDNGTVRGKIQLNSSDRDDLDIKAVSLGSNMKFFTVDTERMRIDSAGNVGIGTTSPLGKLQVNEYTVASQGNQGVHGEVSVFANDGDESLFLGLRDSAYPNRGWAINPVAFGVNSSLQFKEHGSTGVRMVIESGGFVGLGVTDPQQKLHIVDTDGANIILNSNTGAENNGIWMTEGGVATPYVNGAYVHYDSTNNVFKINTGTSTLSTRFEIARDTGAIKFNNYNSTNQTGTPTYLLGTDASGNVVKTLTTPSPVTSQAASLYDLIPNGAFTTTYAFTSTAGTYAKVMKGDDVITANGTYTVQMFVNDYAVGGTQYSETYSGIMSWGSSTNTNDTGGGTISEIVLHRSGHAANQGMTYLRTRETTSSEGNELRLEIMCNRTYSAASNVVFKFVRLI